MDGLFTDDLICAYKKMFGLWVWRTGKVRATSGYSSSLLDSRYKIQGLHKRNETQVRNTEHNAVRWKLFVLSFQNFEARAPFGTILVSRHVHTMKRSFL